MSSHIAFIVTSLNVSLPHKAWCHPKFGLLSSNQRLFGYNQTITVLHPEPGEERGMRNLLFALLLSGCASFITEAETAHIKAEKMYNAETLCMDQKELGHTVEYDTCIENVLGINQASHNKQVTRDWREFPYSELALEASKLSGPERICNKYGFTINTPQRGVCLENASCYAGK